MFDVNCIKQFFGILTVLYFASSEDFLNLSIENREIIGVHIL